MELMSREKLIKQILIKKEIHRREAKNDFWSFCLYIDYDFFTKRELVLKPVAEAFQEIERGVINLLYVGMPPRTGKSYITTLFCGWMLGKYPEEAIMRNTVTATLYNKFSADLRSIIKGETHKEKYKKVFPYIELKTENLDGWKLTTSRHGISYFGAGVGGSIIGFGCTKAAILDDSVKNEEEAMSETMLEKKWNWYTSTHKSRMEKGCPEIHIATRWSKRDIPGVLIKKGIFNEKRAKKIVIPALVEGKSFCPDVHTTEEYLQIKRITPNVIWEAEYMQNPVEAEGLLFPPDELKWFELKELKGEPDAIVGFCDTADEGSDFLSFLVAYQFGEKYFITDVVFNQDKIEITQPQVAGKIKDHKVQMIRVESNNGGRTYAVDIERLLKMSKYYCDVKWKASTTNKQTRILMQSGFIKEHFYFREDYKEGSEYANFIRQIITYTKEGKVKHDDAPDSITGLSIMVRGNTSVTDVKLNLNFGRRTSPWDIR